MVYLNIYITWIVDQFWLDGKNIYNPLREMGLMIFPSTLPETHREFKRCLASPKDVTRAGKTSETETRNLNEIIHPLLRVCLKNPPNKKVKNTFTASGSSPRALFCWYLISDPSSMLHRNKLTTTGEPSTCILHQYRITLLRQDAWVWDHGFVIPQAHRPCSRTSFPCLFPCGSNHHFWGAIS